MKLSFPRFKKFQQFPIHHFRFFLGQMPAWLASFSPFLTNVRPLNGVSTEFSQKHGGTSPQQGGMAFPLPAF